MEAIIKLVSPFHKPLNISCYINDERSFIYPLENDKIPVEFFGELKRLQEQGYKIIFK